MLISSSPASPISSSSLGRRRPLLRSSHSSSISSSASSSSSSCCSGRFAEVAGGTTAECAAICCCCPCGLVNLLILTIYKVPAGLCRRALKKKRRQNLIKKGLLPPRTRRCKCGCDDTEQQIHPMAAYDNNHHLSVMKCEEEEESEEMIKLEKEMWETFSGTGFWRSPSQRETALPPASIQAKIK